MGEIRFFAPNHDSLPRQAIDNALLSGMDGVPWYSVNRWQHEPNASPVLFALERTIDESGNLSIPWRVEGYGELMLATASLRETKAAYNLPLELARGVLNRVRNQVAEWQMAGLVVDDELANKIQVASSAFIDAITAIPDAEKTAEAAQHAIRCGLAASDALCAEYSQQALAARHQSHERLPTMLGVTLRSEPLTDACLQTCAETFNTGAISFAWRAVEQNAGKHEWDVFDKQLEWCQAQGLRIIGGPLLQFDETHLPDWIYLWEDDFEQLQGYLNQYIRATVKHYCGRVQVWNCAARMNVTGAITLSEEQRLRLIVGAIDELRRNDPHTPLIVSFDLPWGENLAAHDRDLSPLHLADSLIRADLGVIGVGVELNIGFVPGTFRRELLEYSRQLDRWSTLGKPLIVYLTAPSSAAEDTAARKPIRPPQCEASPRSQAEFIDRLIPLMLSKQLVQGVIWNELTDAAPHEFAHGGLFDAQGVAKPVVEVLAKYRRQHLT